MAKTVLIDYLVARAEATFFTSIAVIFGLTGIFFLYIYPKYEMAAFFGIIGALFFFLGMMTSHKENKLKKEIKQ